MSQLSPIDILEMSTDSLVDWLGKNFYVPVPNSVQTIEEANQIAKIMPIYANNYFYLTQLHSFALSYARSAKRAGDKVRGEDLSDKRDIIHSFLSAVKFQYNAMSRMITIRSDNNDELHMSDF